MKRQVPHGKGGYQGLRALEAMALHEGRMEICEASAVYRGYATGTTVESTIPRKPPQPT